MVDGMVEIFSSIKILLLLKCSPQLVPVDIMCVCVYFSAIFRRLLLAKYFESISVVMATQRMDVSPSPIFYKDMRVSSDVQYKVLCRLKMYRQKL